MLRAALFKRQNTNILAGSSPGRDGRNPYSRTGRKASAGRYRLLLQAVPEIKAFQPAENTVDSYLSIINPPNGTGFAHRRALDMLGDVDDPEATTIVPCHSVSDIVQLAFALSSELPQEIKEEIVARAEKNRGIISRRTMFDVIDEKILSGEYLVEKRPSYLSPEGLDLYEFVVVRNKDYVAPAMAEVEKTEEGNPDGTGAFEEAKSSIENITAQELKVATLSMFMSVLQGYSIEYSKGTQPIKKYNKSSTAIPYSVSPGIEYTVDESRIINGKHNQLIERLRPIFSC